MGCSFRFLFIVISIKYLFYYSHLLLFVRCFFHWLTGVCAVPYRHIVYVHVMLLDGNGTSVLWTVYTNNSEQTLISSICSSLAGICCLAYLPHFIFTSLTPLHPFSCVCVYGRDYLDWSDCCMNTNFFLPCTSLRLYLYISLFILRREMKEFEM